MRPNFLFEDEKSFDSLTKIYTRDVVVDYVNFLVAEGLPFSLAIVDIDNFKYVNDTFGHITGDSVLVEVAGRIKATIGAKGIVGRFGGDEFLIVFPEITGYNEIWENCHNLMKSMNISEIKAGLGLYVTITMGISRFPENGLNYESLLETADKALYRGKTKGRNCFIIYLPEKHANIELKTEKDRTLSSMYLHFNVFETLTKPEKLKTGIKNLFSFLSSYYMIDHICLQKGNKIYFQKIHKLSRTKDFAPIKIELAEKLFYPMSDFFYVNQTEAFAVSNHVELAENYIEQRIKAAFCCKVTTTDKGELVMLRVDSTVKRVWQHGEMDIYITMAKVLEMLYKEGKLVFD